MKKISIKIPEIVQKNSSVLHTTAKTVEIKDIPSTKIQKIIADMRASLESQLDGVAIAAPQINVPLRIFVVSKRAEIIMRGLENMPDNEKNKLVDPVYINPEITKLSRKKALVDEGCLSVRYLYGRVKRSDKATITAYDETGKKFIQGASGLLSQIFQHEIDHLNGILFIDKAQDVVEILPEKEKNV